MTATNSHQTIERVTRELDQWEAKGIVRDHHDERSHPYAFVSLLAGHLLIALPVVISAAQAIGAAMYEDAKHGWKDDKRSVGYLSSHNRVLTHISIELLLQYGYLLL